MALAEDNRLFGRGAAGEYEQGDHHSPRRHRRRRIVSRLHHGGFRLRIASRHPNRSRRLFGSDTDLLQSIPVDIHNEGSVQKAVSGVDTVVNAVSLYVEHGSETFQSVHVDAARRVTRAASEAGVRRLAHISGIGSDARSSSKYIKARGGVNWPCEMNSRKRR